MALLPVQPAVCILGEQLTDDHDVKGMLFIAKNTSGLPVAAESGDFEMQTFEQLGTFKTKSGAFSHEFQVECS